MKLSGHVAMRRYVEKNRLTFVWECVGTCQNDPYSTKVVQMHEKGWYVSYNYAAGYTFMSIARQLDD